MGETGPCGPAPNLLRHGLEAAEHAGVDKPFATMTRVTSKSGTRLHAVRPRRHRRSATRRLPTSSPRAQALHRHRHGLERVSAVLQGKVSNFETDLFTPLIEKAAELTNIPFAGKSVEELVSNASLRIIADHARAATFLINDGVLPSNEGRGYVLRKILRRGIRHGRLLGQEHHSSTTWSTLSAISCRRIPGAEGFR